MTTNEKLIHEVENTLSGEPRYGDPIYSILDKVTFESTYERVGHAHTIAEILLHMVSWTEEVMDRLNEKPASLPVSGNWPHPGDPDENKWQLWIEDLKLVNVNLIKTIRDFPEDKWDEPIIDERKDAPVTTYKELLYGFIQHQIYHAAQVALLVRAIIG
ncbi:DinB family protein [Mucilaginibacter sp. S1162]|uniref:DinB family protein n=1 Tax=Mucilaginibacter humi TaxID=2732510 RepID=A0ABX1W1P2_9SPHI|nr:DinB family protein [Mucilaginibacter humi]NNU33154.1 DinB family protein [Mucilaginibacter humi]